MIHCMLRYWDREYEIEIENLFGFFYAFNKGKKEIMLSSNFRCLFAIISFTTRKNNCKSTTNK